MTRIVSRAASAQVRKSSSSGWLSAGFGRSARFDHTASVQARLRDCWNSGSAQLRKTMMGVRGRSRRSCGTTPAISTELLPTPLDP
jgi:hypothetical protein